jgi:nucleoside-diphosphate-sugar epimerase
LTNISVFGGTGFIGSNFSSLSKLKVQLVDKEIPDPKFPEVLYLIGTTDNYNIFENPNLDIETNLSLLIENLELLRKKFGKFTFNFASSWFVYGETDSLPFKTNQPCKPKGFYSISKYAAEMYIESYCKTYGIDYRIFRFANVFGSGDAGISQKKNALQFLVGKIKNNEALDLYEGGNFLRDYIDVRDLVTAIDLLVTKGELNKIYNVGSGIPAKFIDVISAANRAFNSSSQINSIQTPEFHKLVQVKDAYLDISDLSKLGFTPQYNVIDEIINL